MTAPRHRDRRTSRRGFLRWGVWIIAGIFSFLLGIPIVGFVFSALLGHEPEQWVEVCSLDQINTVVPKNFRIAFKKEDAPESYEDVRAVFVIQKDIDILAFSNVCTHMGCSVRWIDWREQILCPCHGGAYDRWGNLIGGPPAHSLPLYVSRVENNILYVANRFEGR